MAQNRERIGYLDALKGLAAFLVVLGHLVTAKQEYQGIYNFIYSFHMPLFMFVSGVTAALSFRRYASGNITAGQVPAAGCGQGKVSGVRGIEKWNYLGRRFLNIMVPYISWGILIPVMSALLHGGSIDWKEEFRNMFVTNTAYWFLPTLYGLLVSYMLYVVLNERVPWPGKSIWVWKDGLFRQFLVWGVVAALFLALYLLTGYQLFRDMIGYMIPFSLAVLYVENAWVGALFHKRGILVVCTVLYMAFLPWFDFDCACVATSLLRMLLGMCMTVVLLQLFLVCADKKWTYILHKMLTFWGQYTLLIYILHGLVMRWCEPIKSVVTGWIWVLVWYFLLSGFSCFVCCAFGMALSYVPVVRTLCLGKRSR